MTAAFLGDELGPRGRRTTRIVSALSVVLILGFLVVVTGRLADKGQLDGDKWRSFTQWSVIKFFLVGLRITMQLALVSMAGAMAVGAVMALARLSRTWLVRLLATAYVEFFRGIPLVLLIYFCALGLPSYGIRFQPFWFVVLGLVIYNSAVLGEIFRAGILSLDRGQTEAAYSLGMGYWQAMLLVVIPQAARRMIPAIVSQLVTLLKDTSLGAAIAFEELLRRAQVNGQFFGNRLQSLIVAALMYIVVCFALSLVARRLEVRQRRRYKSGPIVVPDGMDLAILGASAGPAATASAI